MTDASPDDIYKELRKTYEGGANDAVETVKSYAKELDKLILALKFAYENLAGLFQLREKIRRDATADPAISLEDRVNLLVPPDKKIQKRLELLNDDLIRLQGTKEGSRDALVDFYAHRGGISMLDEQHYGRLVDNELEKDEADRDPDLQDELNVSLIKAQEDKESYNEKMSDEGFPSDTMYLQWSGWGGTPDEVKGILGSKDAAIYRTLKYFGYVFAALGEVEQAIYYYREALKISREKKWTEETEELEGFIRGLEEREK